MILLLYDLVFLWNSKADKRLPVQKTFATTGLQRKGPRISNHRRNNNDESYYNDPKNFIILSLTYHQLALGQCSHYSLKWHSQHLVVCHEVLGYGGPQLSHQIQIPHIKYKLLTSNTKSWHQIQITHIKNKLLLSNTNYSHQIQNPDIKHKLLTSNTQIAHIKYKLLTSITKAWDQKQD